MRRPLDLEAIGPDAPLEAIAERKRVSANRHMATAGRLLREALQLEEEAARRWAAKGVIQEVRPGRR